MASLKLSQFIEIVLIEQLQSLVDSGISPYLCFLNIAVGIEFLADCLDENVQKNKTLESATSPIERKYKEGEKKYRHILKHHFPNKHFRYYRNMISDLYRLFRCGMAHLLIPYPGIRLATKKEEEKFQIKHLKNDSSGISVLILEEFMKDFVIACQSVVDKLKNDDKYCDFHCLEVPDDKTDFISTITVPSSGWPGNGIKEQ